MALIDFVSSMNQRTKKEWFGDFEFVSYLFEKDVILEDEEVNVRYKDNTTNEIHVVQL